ncbi:hypothetical protein D6827_02440 [Candidatus Parcubacteria bacterium]|nr:MAG: hypothetical protein D6827_02440 [Candidatus Parcubacteria bacterium]
MKNYMLALILLFLSCNRQPNSINNQAEVDGFWRFADDSMEINMQIDVNNDKVSGFGWFQTSHVAVYIKIDGVYDNNNNVMIISVIPAPYTPFLMHLQYSETGDYLSGVLHGSGFVSKFVKFKRMADLPLPSKKIIDKKAKAKQKNLKPKSDK